MYILGLTKPFSLDMVVNEFGLKQLMGHRKVVMQTANCIVLYGYKSKPRPSIIEV